jgi:hypothetical protein
MKLFKFVDLCDGEKGNGKIFVDRVLAHLVALRERYQHSSYRNNHSCGSAVRFCAATGDVKSRSDDGLM